MRVSYIIYKIIYKKRKNDRLMDYSELKKKEQTQDSA